MFPCIISSPGTPATFFVKNCYNCRYRLCSTKKEEVKHMKISARNMLKGKVKKITHGAVNSEIIVELSGGTEIVSIITKSSAENLGLSKGKEVYAVIKASTVMIAVD
jgi:molybdopterin-binding protein